MPVPLSEIIKKLEKDSAFQEQSPKILSAFKKLEDKASPVRKMERLDRLEKLLEWERVKTKSWQLSHKANLKILLESVRALKEEAYKEVYLSAMDQVVQGPLMKSDATIEFEAVARGLLTQLDKASCRYNAAGELEITIDKVKYNLTEILRHKPNLEHLTFSSEELDQYADFIRNEARNQPRVQVNGGYRFPTAAYYKKHDPQKMSGDLSLGEKYAITLYTSDYYKHMQKFLRTSGKEGLQHENTMLDEVQELILAISIASHALSKPQNLGMDTHRFAAVTRGEDNSQNTRNEEYITQARTKQVSLNTGFTSSSASNKVSEDFAGDTHITIVQPEKGIGKKIKHLSKFSEEEETLFLPTQFKVVDHKESDKTYFVAVPVRTPEGTPDHKAYSKFKREKMLREAPQSLPAQEKEAPPPDKKPQAAPQKAEVSHELSHTGFFHHSAVEKVDPHILAIKNQRPPEEVALIDEISNTIKKITLQIGSMSSLVANQQIAVLEATQLYLASNTDRYSKFKALADTIANNSQFDYGAPKLGNSEVKSLINKACQNNKKELWALVVEKQKGDTEGEGHTFKKS